MTTFLSKAKIVKASEVVADGHGFFYKDLELDNGVKGYYPNTEEFLNKLVEGKVIQYIDTKEFAKRTKINGLVLIEKTKKMSNKVITIVKSTSTLQKGEKGIYFKELTTEDGITAIFHSKELSEVETIISGSLISYSDIKNLKGKDVFFGVEKLKRYHADDRRQLSIMRQSSIKAAIECIAIASPKGRWLNKDGVVDKQACYSEVIELAEMFIEYCTVE